MRSKHSASDEDLLPFGAPQGDSGDFAASAKRAPASSGTRQRSPLALRPLWYSIPFLVLALLAATYLIGLTLWSRSSLGHWKAQEYEAAKAGYEGQMGWTSVGVEQWVAHYNLGTTLLTEKSVDEGVAELLTAFELVPKSIEVEPGRLESSSYECRVRANLGRGIEMQGDAKDAEGANLDAYNLYAEAEEMLSPCQTPANQLSSTGADTNPADRGKERTSDKKQKSDKKNKGEDPNGDPSGDPNEDPNKGDDPSNNEDPESTPAQVPPRRLHRPRIPSRVRTAIRSSVVRTSFTRMTNTTVISVNRTIRGAVATLTVPGDLRIRVSLWL